MSQVARLVPYLLTIAFVAWCLYSLHGDLSQLSLAPVLRAWDIVLAATLLSVVNYALRIFRWRSYLSRLGHDVTLRFAALTFVSGFAYTLSPGKVGEMVRARYYTPLGIPLGRVMAAFLAERLMDLVAMLVLAMLLFTAVAAYEGAFLGAVLLVVVALVSLALVPWSSAAEWARNTSKIPAFARKACISLTEGLAGTRELLRPVPLISGFLIGLVAWGVEGAGLGLLSSMFSPPHMPLITAIGIYGMAVLIGGLSFLPGGLGGTEAVMTALLVTRGYPLGESLLLTLICRLVTLWFAVILGWGAVLMLRQRPVKEPVPWQ